MSTFEDLTNFTFVTKKDPSIYHTSCFWAMDDKKALATEVVVEHDNHDVLRAIVVSERTKVQMLESYNANNEERGLPQIVERWVFKGYEVSEDRLEQIKATFKSKKLRGLAQPSTEFLQVD